MQGVLTEMRMLGSTSSGVLLIVLGAIALPVPFFASLFLIRLITWLLLLAAIEQVICGLQTRGEGGYSSKFCWLCCTGPEACYAAGPLAGAMAVTALTGFCELSLHRRWGGVVTVDVRRSFDARIGARLTPAGAFPAGSEPASSDRAHPGR